ncbi:hypothetical protein K1T71_010387 [Dendrolimus kikuchii]|uniref:Uncharacterized protein n=1 Tax=Dendrolimus kikuchii TaxID=765133 RepID=A0ACC1CRG3_9NEOP|nr:hypothetical protein K1T71_010387 [Dendrolimus kikuchii]
MGAKDVILALRWIRNNIFIFHGDQNRVTVVGTQSSANLVSSLLLTSVSEDLFARVIIQSGCALSPAEYKSYSFEISNKLYWNLNGSLKKFNRTKLYEILSNASISELLLASEELFDSTEVRDCQRLINSFGLTVERTKKGAFMNKFPLEVYKSRLANNDVEVMLGYTSLECLYKLKGFVNNRKLLKYLNYNFQYLLPFEGRQDEYESKRYKKIRRKIMDFYFVNGTIKERSLRRYTKYVSDQVIYPLIRQARLHTGVSFNNVYLYRFSFKGSLSVVWNTSVRNLNWGGATGGDEICYQFRCKSADGNYESTEPSERRFIKKIARLLANFARFG